MPAGKPRYAKAGRDDYVFNRPAPAVAALPRATEDLLVAYRIFSPGLGELTDLDAISASVFKSIGDGSCNDLMQSLGVGTRNELRELCKKSCNVYAAEIKRMIAVENAEAVKLAEKLAASEASKQAQQEQREKLIVEKQKLAQNDPTATTNKRRRADADADAELTESCLTKRARRDNSNDMIPNVYWLSKEQAQATLDAISARANKLGATFDPLQKFFRDTFVNDSNPAIPTITRSMNYLETQIRKDITWYVEELQKIMAGAPSSELGIKKGLEGGWKRDRFHNAAVRGMIERIREFGARLKDTEREMDEARRLQEVFAEDDVGCIVTREMHLQRWAKQLLRVTNTVAHEAKEYVTFRTMEAEWEEKWAPVVREEEDSVPLRTMDKDQEKMVGEGEKERSNVEVIVIDDSSDSDDFNDLLFDESEESEEE